MSLFVPFSLGFIRRQPPCSRCGCILRFALASDLSSQRETRPPKAHLEAISEVLSLAPFPFGESRIYSSEGIRSPAGDSSHLRGESCYCVLIRLMEETSLRFDHLHVFLYTRCNDTVPQALAQSSPLRSYASWVTVNIAGWHCPLRVRLQLSRVKTWL